MISVGFPLVHRLPVSVIESPKLNTALYFWAWADAAPARSSRAKHGSSCCFRAAIATADDLIVPVVPAAADEREGGREARKAAKKKATERKRNGDASCLASGRAFYSPRDPRFNLLSNLSPARPTTLQWL